MKDQHGRYPAYLPYSQRLFLKARKVYRQANTRLAESKAMREGSGHLVPDGRFEGLKPDVAVFVNSPTAINKGAWWLEEDLSRPELYTLVKEMENLKKRLAQKSLRFTNTAATFLPRMFYPRSERSKIWENAWVICHSNINAGDRVLDIGGASTPFSFYLADRQCSVAVLDNDWANCGTIYNANYVAKRMGWDLKAYNRDISKPFPFPDNSFDRVFSICTIEHLTSAVRRFMMKETARVLKTGGIAGITMCYDLNHPVLLVDKGLRFGYRQKLEADVIGPSGLTVYGNTDLVDYEGIEFLGALFLVKNS